MKLYNYKKYFPILLKKKLNNKTELHSYRFLKLLFCRLYVRKGKYAMAERFFFYTLDNYKKSNPYFFILSYLRFYSLFFKLLGIRKYGKIINIPVPISFLKQYSQTLRHFFFFIKNQSNYTSFVKMFRLFFSSKHFEIFNENIIKQLIYNKKYFRYRW